MRKFLGFISILGFIAAILVFTLADATFQLAFVTGIFLFTLFTVSFYGLTLLEEKKMEVSRRFPKLTVIIPLERGENTSARPGTGDRGGHLPGRRISI